MRLIDADTLMSNAEYKGKHDILTAYDIVAAPTVDAVLVVRCKDCKFYTARNYIEKTGICTLATRHLGDDGYCSEGERKEGNTGEIS